MLRLSLTALPACTVHSSSYVKRHHPERYRHILIACGNFHAFGHFIFAVHQTFFDSYMGYWCKVLHREKVPKFIMSLQDDAYRHALSLHLEATIGTDAYFLLDVEHPPADMYLSNPMLYDSMIESAGGKTAFKYILHGGNPILHWLRAGRESDGDKVEKLHTVGFHMNRATTHKVNCVMISLLALWSTCATEPAIARIVKELVSLSLTGKVDMFCDRLLEYLNYMQDLRDGKFAAFEKAIHYSDQVEALLHVGCAWDAAEKGESPLNDPLTQAMLNGAQRVRKTLRDKLGTDLTQPTDTNPLCMAGSRRLAPSVPRPASVPSCGGIATHQRYAHVTLCHVGRSWHTGNAVKVRSSTNVKGHAPWDYIRRVALGKVAGEGRADPVSWEEHVQHVVDHQMFPF